MVASVSALTSAAQAASYYEADDYYAEGGLAPSEWLGEGAKALGLAGEVDRERFVELLEGKVATKQLGTIREGKLEHRPGWDITLSAPKSVSIMAEVAGEAGIGYVDGPVSGGQAGAENGALTVMVGGEQGHFDIAEAVAQAYSKAVTLMGPAGSGQLTKAVNQICIAGLVQGLSEGLAFADKAGLDAGKVGGVISKGAAQSWQMDNRAETMIDDKFDFGFAVEWVRKDLGIALTEARGNGALLPATALVDQFYAEVVAMGGSRWDTSSLIRLLTRKG